MRYKALLLVMIVVGTSLLILASAPSEVKAAPHDPIFIESDSELESMADTEGWAGSGSAVDPFIIENYIIDAKNASNGIIDQEHRPSHRHQELRGAQHLGRCLHPIR